MDITKIEKDYNALLNTCERFLMKYDDVLYSENYFGLALDEAFADELEPMYAAVQMSKINVPNGC